ncbi:MAG TPA: CCA tRNA nucleotidyltransferase [Candidatus Limnocylindria bacterium]|nr:CCA tRNA nucleotidyltransferase [Candidatus Limnocylindria bacterium]
MAQLPLPGRSGPISQLSQLSDGAAYAIGDLPEAPARVLRALAGAGHEAVLVGGCLRDLLLGARPDDWDVATAALPATVSALFPGSWWENRFGTVTVPGAQPVQVTTYRSESGYADRRRPDEVTFHGSLRDDLARRDFTINAVAWLPEAPGGGTSGRLVDPFDGLVDLRDGVIRAVGDPAARFAEDALRVLRGVRFALRFGFRIEAVTEAALADAAPATAGLSAERVRDELLRLLADPGIRPTVAFARWEALGLLATLLPELAALRGIPQGKPLPGDALDHTLRTAEALPASDPILRMAGLLHDVGKATTFADGHFYGHEVEGAHTAEAVMRRLRFGAQDVARVRELIRHHMFAYEPAWTDAAVRRFIRRVGHERLGDLFALREADDAGSGAVEPPAGGLPELRARIAEQENAPLAHGHLAVDGHDLQRVLDVPPGPGLGRLLDRLMEEVVDDPSLNRREMLLRRAGEILAER